MGLRKPKNIINSSNLTNTKTPKLKNRTHLNLEIPFQQIIKLIIHLLGHVENKNTTTHHNKLLYLIP